MYLSVKRGPNNLSKSLCWWRKCWKSEHKGGIATEHKLVVKFLAIKITKIAEDEAEDKMVIVK